MASSSNQAIFAARGPAPKKSKHRRDAAPEPSDELPPLAAAAATPEPAPAPAEDAPAEDGGWPHPEGRRGGVDSDRFIAARSTKLPSRVLKQPEPLDPKELLDDRDCPDVDEQSLDNEQRLAQFVKLHPMLSLDATSHRTLSAAADLIATSSVKCKPVEYSCPKHDSMYLRPPRNNERECVNGDNCIVMWLAGFRYGEESQYSFTCREYLTPNEQTAYENTGELPSTQGKCLVCARYFQTYVYTICRSDPHFTLSPKMALHAFCNDPAHEDAVKTVASATKAAGTYKEEKLLFIDEKFKSTNAARGELAHLVWQPTVRFNATDYQFALGEAQQPYLIQVGMTNDDVDPQNNTGGSTLPAHTRISHIFPPNPARDPNDEEPTEKQQPPSFSGGGVFLSATQDRLRGKILHRDFAQSGIAASLKRTLRYAATRLPPPATSATSTATPPAPPLAWVQGLATPPNWLFDDDFGAACAETTIKTLHKWQRRFGRLEQLYSPPAARSGVAPSSELAWMDAARHAELALTACRIAMGAACEAICAHRASAIAPPTRLPAAPQERELARACADGYAAATFVEAHATFAHSIFADPELVQLLETLEPHETVVQGQGEETTVVERARPTFAPHRASPHVSFGGPSLQLTYHAFASLPDVATFIESHVHGEPLRLQGSVKALPAMEASDDASDAEEEAAKGEDNGEAAPAESTDASEGEKAGVRELAALLVRSTQSGIKGWIPALRLAATTTPFASTVAVRVFQAALLGLHPQLHPACRMHWTRRLTLGAVLDEVVTVAMLQKLPCASKEAMRFFMAVLLVNVGATARAMRLMGSPFGVLRSCPDALPDAAVFAAAAHFVRAAAAGEAAVAKPHSSAKTVGAAIVAVLAEFDNARATITPDEGCGACGSANESQAVCMLEALESSNPDGRTLQQTLAAARALATTASTATTTSSASKPKTSAKNVVGLVKFNACWTSRATARVGNSHMKQKTVRLNAMRIVDEFLTKIFRASFAPIWLHSLGIGARICRFDATQRTSVHEASPIYKLVQSMPDDDVLWSVHEAMHTSNAHNIDIVTLASRAGASADALQILRSSPSLDACVVLLGKLEAREAGKIIVFCMIVALKERLLAFDLGVDVTLAQVKALQMRYGLGRVSDVPPVYPHSSEDEKRAYIAAIVARLPKPATTLFRCHECSRIANACSMSSTILHSFLPFNEIGLSQTMLRLPTHENGYELKCSKRSSAALRTSYAKENESSDARVEMIEPTDATIEKGFAALAETPGGLAKLKRDGRCCSSQESRALACGERDLVEIPIVGKLIRIDNCWMTTCTFCGCLFKLEHRVQSFGTAPCCLRCDPLMMIKGTDLMVHFSPPPPIPPKPEEQLLCKSFPEPNPEVTNPRLLPCRFCGKAPPVPPAPSRFRITRAPLDCFGKNKSVPAPLRAASWCPTHWRPWLTTAMASTSMSVVLAHVSEKACPVNGAQTGRRCSDLLEMQNDRMAAKKRTSRAGQKLEKRMRGGLWKTHKGEVTFVGDKRENVSGEIPVVAVG